MNQKQKVIEYRRNLYVKSNINLKHFYKEVGTIYTKDCLEGYVASVVLYIDEDNIKIIDKELDDLFCMKYNSTTNIQQSIIFYNYYSQGSLHFDLKITKYKTGVQLIDIYINEDCDI